LVGLDPTLGHEIRKTRPAVIVTSDLYNRHNWVVLVVPLTSADTAAYDQVLVQPPEGGLERPSVTLPDQMRAVDRRRLVKRLGRLSEHTSRLIDRSLRIVLDLI
jgi:mRNA interferase MazF